MAIATKDEKILHMDECDAWFGYLQDTRGKTDKSYEDLESWAWARLQERLRKIGEQREKLAA